MKRNTILLIMLCFAYTANAQLKHSAASAFKSYKGLVMAGYQGWFNALGDGGQRGWNHYAGAKGFAPGSIKIDVWPDVSEYKKTYKTAFQHEDGSPAYLFSSYDESTVQLHFKWMEQYGIDGVFVQRFVSNLKNTKSLAHNNKVLRSALDAAGKHKRAISLMYDFSGMQEGDEGLVISDFKHLVDSLRLTTRGNKQSYLYHNQKPLVALWGIGFNDKRRYTLKTITKIMDFLQHDPVYGGCSLLLGVPTQWRELKGDAIADPELLEVCKKADIIQPWFVGRFKEENIPVMMERIKADIAWCKANRLDFVPVVYPGFSWHNMKPNSPFDQIPRNRGQFFWKQLSGAINSGVEMVYVAMFDEVDEGTAIFKASKNPPVGENRFVKFEEGIPNDYYLYLAGFASKMLKKEIPFQNNIPLPK
ncbi:glycoside hydrolase family 71/99-like protein [Pedobacter miscanthi]|uniref:Xylosidase n=1 Tax=Pedobacter miscanthi TaxID=2259170 RepID=A0A366LDN0_9SPHI|nr:glycoside hydrolase family 71/99-like protein [Pedobacter miscanthi]RBQ11384.1 xylosidase [Pedobacter miscanthi]